MRQAGVMTETEAVEAYVRQVGRRVRAARTLAGMTQKELGAHIGKSQSYVSHCELGRLPFGVADLFIAAAVFQLDPQDFTATHATGVLRAA